MLKRLSCPNDVIGHPEVKVVDRGRKKIVITQLDWVIQGEPVKLIIAIIQPYKLEEVKQELYKREINLLTVSEVLGHGRQKGVTEVYRSTRESGNFLRKIRLEIAVNDNFVEPTIEAILKGAKTGETGDGKIFVLDLKECIRIRTGEKGGEAIG